MKLLLFYSLQELLDWKLLKNIGIGHETFLFSKGMREDTLQIY